MKKTDINCFVVREIRDTGGNPVIARFSTEREARKLTPLIGGYGGEVMAERIEFIVYETFEEYMDQQRGALMKSALAKLTKEEMFALGIGSVQK